MHNVIWKKPINYNHRLHATCGCVAKMQLQVVRRKPQAAEAQAARLKPQAAEAQATTCGCITETQAASSKPQAPRHKPQGSSPENQAP